METVENYIYFLKTVSSLTSSSEDIYRREILKFFHYLKKYSNIGQNDVLRYLEHLKKYAISTASRKVTIIKGFFRYLEMQGKIPSSPFNKIYRVIRPGNNHQKQSKPTLTREQISKLLSPEAAVGKMRFDELRDEVIIRLFLASGIRRKELLTLKTTDIDFEINEIIIRAENSKRKKERLVFFDNITAQWLKWYISRRKSHKRYSKQSFLFITHTGRTMGLGALRKLIEDKFEKIGLGRKFKCHLFRHTCATMLLEHGADPKAVQDLLGHKNISTTFDTYTHLSQDYLRKVYKKTNPFRDLSSKSLQ